MAAITDQPASIVLNAELDEIITKLARKAGKPKAEYFWRLVLDAIEDAEDYMLAEEAVEEFHREGGKTYSSEEVRRQLGLDD